MLGFHHIRDATLARLAVDPDHRLVVAPHVLGVDRQIRDTPLLVVIGQGRKALLDGILVRAGERGVHQVPYVRMPGADREAVAVFRHPAQLVDVPDVEFWVDALAEQVQSQVHQIDVAGSLAVAEQCAFHPIGACHDAELSRGHCCPPVIVGMQRQDDLVPARHVAMEPLDGVAIHIGGVALDGGGQVQDDLSIDGRLDDIHHRPADLHRVVQLGAREALRRVFVPDRGGRNGLLKLAAQPGCVYRDLGDARLVEAEYDSPLQHRRRVVEVDDGPRGTLDALVGPVDQFRPALNEDLDGHVVGDQIVFDQLAYEVVVRLRG